MVLLLAWDVSASALEVPPFDPEQHVVLVPRDPSFRTVAASAAVAQASHPAYVVVFARVIDGHIEPDHETETEDAIEAVWEAWSTDPRFDPAESNLTVLALDDREVRIRAGTRWDAELGLAQSALLPLIDRGFMPRAQAGDLDGALAGVVTELDREVDRRLGSRSRARLARNGAAGAGGLGLLGAAVFGAVGRGRRARRAFEAAIAHWRRAIEQAEQRWAELGLDVELRDQVVALKLRGPATRALVDDVTARLDRIRVGLDAMRRRVDEVAQGARGGPLAVAAWRAAISALNAPFEHDTGAGTGLFEPERRTVQITPAQFEADLDAEWRAARAGWDRVVDAVAASMRTARDDLPADDLERMRAALAGAGLPVGWVGEHPLAADPDGTWDRLDGLRREDPVAYLDAIEAAIAADDVLEQQVAALIGGREAAIAARAEADQVDVSGLDTVTAGDDDPERLRADVDAQLEALAHALATPGDADAVAALAVAATEAGERLGQLRRAIAEAVRDGARRVEEARSEVAALDEAVRGARGRLHDALAHHAPATVAGAAAELAEADEDQLQAHRALAEAEAALAGRAHLAAVRAAEAAVAEQREALVDLKELSEALARAEAERNVALDLWASLEGVRARHGLSASAGDLADGDRQLQALRGQWDAPGDWAARLAAVHAVMAAWRAGEAAAAERARQRERERRDAERRRAAAVSSARSSSFSSGRASGSSYRTSASSSSSSSSRSAGRSYSSSGRSAGRKF
jgi:hypothetical protein